MWMMSAAPLFSSLLAITAVCVCPTSTPEVVTNLFYAHALNKELREDVDLSRTNRDVHNSLIAKQTYAQRRNVIRSDKILFFVFRPLPHRQFFMPPPIAYALKIISSIYLVMV